MSEGGDALFQNSTEKECLRVGVNIKWENHVSSSELVGGKDV